jgi:hypothetical protein
VPSAVARRTAAPVVAPPDEAAARRELRRQIADLERRLSDVVVSGFPHAGRAEATAPAQRPPAAGARLLALGELEALRDDLATSLAGAQARLGALGREQERARARLERMLREPGRHRFERVSNAELGEGGCGVWQVRPRLGLLGMLAGWWEVKLSSGCPLA